MVIVCAEVFVTKNVRPTADASVTVQVYVDVFVKATGKFTCTVVAAVKLALPTTMKAFAI
jgi:hypothetical protein